MHVSAPDRRSGAQPSSGPSDRPTDPERLRALRSIAVGRLTALRTGLASARSQKERALLSTLIAEWERALSGPWSTTR